MRIFRCFSLAVMIGLMVLASAQINASATVEPTSGKIAFVSERDGVPRIYVMDADGKNQQQLTTEEATRPAWSWDDKQIAFTSYRTGSDKIYIMNADGSNLRQISDGWDPAFSPDDKQIVYGLGDLL